MNANAAQVDTGPFMLDRKVEKPDPSRVPVRGDIAHIALANTYFVPHYAVPVAHTVAAEGAGLFDAPNDAEPLATLTSGSAFEVLDEIGDWVWGCVSLQGPVGYVRRAQLHPAG